MSKELKVVATIIARTNSRRLPKKVLSEIQGAPLISFLFSRILKCKGIDSVYLATSWEEGDAGLTALAEKQGVNTFRGDPLSVIDRMIMIGEKENADYIIRITGDNPFTDRKLLEQLIDRTVRGGFDYGRAEGVPLGSSAEVISFSSLLECRERIKPELSEYLMLYLYDPKIFKVLVLDCGSWIHGQLSLTVDTPEDLMRTRFIGENAPAGMDSNLSEILALDRVHGVPFFRVDNETDVKLPEGRRVSYQTFKEDMRRRLTEAQSVIKVEQEDYLKWAV